MWLCPSIRLSYLPPSLPLSVWHAARFAFRYVSFFYYVLLPLSLLLLLLSLYSSVSVFLQQICYGTGVKKGLSCRVKGVPVNEMERQRDRYRNVSVKLQARLTDNRNQSSAREVQQPHVKKEKKK